MHIQPTFAQSVQADSLAALNRLLAYRNDDVIARYREDSGATELEADTAWDAFLQFMAVCMFRSERVTATPSADGIWHTFLLYTKQYAAFCDEYLGGFVHHEPTSDYGSPKDYQDSRAFAERIFGQLDQNGWPQLMGRLKCFSARSPEDVRRFN